MEALGQFLTWLVVPGLALAAALYLRDHGGLRHVRSGMVFGGLLGAAMGLTFTLTGAVSVGMLVFGALFFGVGGAFFWAALMIVFSAGKGIRW